MLIFSDDTKKFNRFVWVVTVLLVLVDTKF